MTAEELRGISIHGGEAGTAAIAEMLREIAAQGAERNAMLRENNDLLRESLKLSYDHSAWQAKLVKDIATKGAE